MRQIARSLIDLWRRAPSAIARLLGEATQYGRPARALGALLAVTILGTGGYVAGATMTDRPSDRQAASADPPESSGGGQPEPTPGTPTVDLRTPGHSAEPSASATGRSKAPSPATATSEIPPPASTSASGSPSTGATSPSTSPTQPGTTASAAPKDTAPPQTSVSEDFLVRHVALLTFSANEPATFACSLDGAAYAPCDSPLRFLDLAAGWHTLAVRATDTAGNTDPTPAESRWHSDRGGAGH
jgi:hypothetical protein